MLDAPSGKRNVTVWRPSVRPVDTLTVTPEGPAHNAASVHFSQTYLFNFPKPRLAKLGQVAVVASVVANCLPWVIRGLQSKSPMTTES